MHRLDFGFFFFFSLFNVYTFFLLVFFIIRARDEPGYFNGVEYNDFTSKLNYCKA